MKYLLAVGLSALGFCFSMAAFWRVHARDFSVGPEAIAGRLDELAADWTAKNVPFDARAVTLVISDADGADDPLALAEPPSVLERLTGWLHRRLAGRAGSSPDSRFARGFAGEAATIAWTQSAYPTAEEEDAVRALMTAIVKAHDAGAELDVVAQGRSAAVVLRAIAALDGAVRGGQKVGVNKLLTVGMNRRALRAFGSAFKAGRPANLREWTAVWNTDSMPRTTELEVLGQEPDAARYTGEMLDPAWGSRPQDAVALVKALIASPAPMRRQLDARVASARSPVSGSAQAPAAPPSPAPPANSGDSLGMISGGSGYKMPEPDAKSSSSESVKRPPILQAKTVVRATRASIRGFDYGMELCNAEFPTTDIQAAFTCSLGAKEKSPPLAEYPDAWIWTSEEHGRAGCWKGAAPDAVGILARRGERKLAPCREVHPAACCVYTAARLK